MTHEYTSEELTSMKTAITETIKQGKRSVNSIGSCVYRAPDGSKCAMGQLIPDDVYGDWMEDKSAEAVIADEPRLKHLSGICVEMSDIQEVHDRSSGDFISEFKEGIKDYIIGEYLPRELMDLVQ